MRLTEIGRKVGLVDDHRYEIFLKKQEKLKEFRKELEVVQSPTLVREFVESYGGKLSGGISYKDMIKRGIPISDIKERFGALSGATFDILETLETDAKYEGYLDKGLKQIEKAKKLENHLLPDDIDYHSIEGLRIEAREKLSKIRPRSLGQAERISGVSPADIAVLMVYLAR
jgi:tRNA uridine 5-carboxymethylaminomethyl modification enzyme